MSPRPREPSYYQPKDQDYPDTEGQDDDVTDPLNQPDTLLSILIQTMFLFVI